MAPSVILQTFLNHLKSYIVIYACLFKKYTSSNIKKLQNSVKFVGFFKNLPSGCPTTEKPARTNPFKLISMAENNLKYDHSWAFFL